MHELWWSWKINRQILIVREMGFVVCYYVYLLRIFFDPVHLALKWQMETNGTKTNCTSVFCCWYQYQYTSNSFLIGFGSWSTEDPKSDKNSWMMFVKFSYLKKNSFLVNRENWNVAEIPDRKSALVSLHCKLFLSGTIVNSF